MISNFRRISLLSIAAKIIEKYVNQLLSALLDQGQILDSAQFGFRPLHSTEPAPLAVDDDL